MSNSIEDWYLVADAAKSLGLSSGTINRWIDMRLITPRAWHHGKRLVLLTDVSRVNNDRPDRGRPAKGLKNKPDL